MKKYIVFIFWIIFVITHTIGLKTFPIFEDEAQYLLLAEAISQNPQKNFFIYSINGLFPLYGWLVAFSNMFINDSLVAGRLINVLVVSSLVLWINRIAKFYNLSFKFELFTMLLFLTSPIVLLNSRIALLDPTVMVFIAWYIYFTAIYIKTHRSKYIYGVLVTFLAATLTKATGIFGIPAVFLIIFKAYKVPEKRKVVINSVSVFIISFLLVYIYFNFFGKQISTDSGSSITRYGSLTDLVNDAKLRVWVTYHWTKAYYLPYFIIPLLFLWKRNNLSNKTLYMVMFAWAFTALAIMITVNRFYYPRHVLIASLPIIVIFSSVLVLYKNFIAYVIFIISVFFQLFLSFSILNDAEKSPIALEDKFEYFENYTSGKRIKEIANFLDSNSDENTAIWLDGSYVIEYGIRKEMINIKPQIYSFRLNEFFVGGTPGEVTKRASKTYVIVNRWKPSNINNLVLVKEFPISFRHTQFIYQLP